jgi:predicted nucleotidyltransferase component of viral defense system
MNEDALKSKVMFAAKTLGVPFNTAFHSLVMERFLARLASSSHAENFVFKGGFLLSRYLDLGRETRDLDFLLQSMRAERETIFQAFTEISARNIGDGFLFCIKNLDDLVHDHMKYAGFTAKLDVTFGKLRDSLDVDIGIGDAVDPIKRVLPLLKSKGEPLFESDISLHVYPAQTIFAEKIHTAALRGSKNSRMKDYFDIWKLLPLMEEQKPAFVKALTSTFDNRETSLEQMPLAFSDEQIEQLQKLWRSFFRNLSNKDSIPDHISEIILKLNDFLKSALRKN